jgi:hypothetical protein
MEIATLVSEVVPDVLSFGAVPRAPHPLPVRLREEPRRLLMRRLHVGFGPAEISIAIPDEDAPVRQVICSAREEPSAGADFVEVFARWLGLQAPPPALAPHLLPLMAELCSRTAVVDEAGEEWHRYGLRFAAHGLSGSLTLWANHRRGAARIEEADPADSSSRGDLVRLFAIAFRDGPPPARTPRTDPRMKTSEPLVSLCPILGPPPTGRGSWVGDTYFAASQHKGITAIWAWPAPAFGAPRLIGELPGMAIEVVASPDGKRAAVTMTYPVRSAACALDRSALLLVDLERGFGSGGSSGVETIIDTEADPRFTLHACRPTFSLDGRSLLYAIVERKPRPPHQPWHRVYDLGSHSVTREAPLAGTLERFSGQAVRLRSGHEGHHAWQRWDLQTGLVEPVPPPTLRSPDARYEVRVEPKALRVVGQGADRRVPMDERRDGGWRRSIIDGTPAWLADRYLLIHAADEWLALDLDTLALRHLDGVGVSHVDASSRGIRLYARRGAEHFFGTLRVD